MFRRDPFSDPELLVERVYAYVAYRLGGGPDAEDVTSEVMERAVRYRHTYDRAKGDPTTWLVGIARRCVSDFRARPTDVPTADVVLLERGWDEDDLQERTVRRLALASAIELLEEREQELIALRYGADLTARKIAELLDERVNTVEFALHRALGRLGALLDAPEPRMDARPRAGRPVPQTPARLVLPGRPPAA